MRSITRFSKIVKAKLHFLLTVSPLYGRGVFPYHVTSTAESRFRHSVLARVDRHHGKFFEALNNRRTSTINDEKSLWKKIDDYFCNN